MFALVLAQVPLQRQHAEADRPRAEGLGGWPVHQLRGLMLQPVGDRDGCGD